jgi:glutathionylspermidine synthase
VIRHDIPPRKHWEDVVREQGLVYHKLRNGKPYWNESAYYSFTMSEIDKLESATNDLQQMCLKAGQYIIDYNLFSKLGIPEAAVPLIKWSWETEPPALYGRFDLGYNGKGDPKLLEYNADTPTALLEASVIQWFWMKAMFPGADQFNSIHEKLVDKWKDLKGYLESPLYFTNIDDIEMEDTMTATYIRDTAIEAGITNTIPIFVKDLGWNKELDCFVDLAGNPIESIFKLYPWEWMVHETFGSNALKTYKSMQWIEPIWKMMFSNKGLLPILWELFPNHPNLLPSFFNDPRDMKDYIKKPLLSREGANIQIFKNKELQTETTGDYGEEGYIFQEFYNASVSGYTPILGSWMIDQDPAGIGIRETEGPITNNLSCFIPHIIE